MIHHCMLGDTTSYTLLLSSSVYILYAGVRRVVPALSVQNGSF